ncbi:hypothetical protein [uncultured Idiomarina sp.]|uniref:hypothetical protein n=1 Tax=uncultured Idiomarina sp. TaxID=352961 RepID=UPI0025929775|nr:hypothetical protein [uncultured Idiomarina sp.]
MDRLCIACGLDWSAIAAWVQAIGSIIAIGVAIAVPARQHKKDQERTKEEKKRRARALSLSLLPVLYKLRASVQHFITEQTAKEPEALVGKDEHDGNFFSHAPELRSYLAIAPDLDEFQELFSKLIASMLQSEEMLNFTTRMQRGGYHSSWINNLEFFIEHANNLNTKNNELIRSIENAHGL